MDSEELRRAEQHFESHRIIHEINQSLSAIASFAGASRILSERDQSINPRIALALKNTESEAHRAGELVKRLRTALCSDRPPSRPTNINEVIRWNVEEAEKRFPQIEFRFQADRSLKRIQAVDSEVYLLIRWLLKQCIDTAKIDTVVTIDNSMCHQDGLSRITVSVSNSNQLDADEQSKLAVSEIQYLMFQCGASFNVHDGKMLQMKFSV